MCRDEETWRPLCGERHSSTLEHASLRALDIDFDESNRRPAHSLQSIVQGVNFDGHHSLGIQPCLGWRPLMAERPGSRTIRESPRQDHHVIGTVQLDVASQESDVLLERLDCQDPPLNPHPPRTEECEESYVGTDVYEVVSGVE